MTRPPRRLAAAALAAASIAMIVSGAVSATAADYVAVPETGTPGRLVLSADPFPAQFLDLRPGEPAYWQIAADIEDADRATLAVELRKAGALVEHPRGLEMRIDTCTVPWTNVPESPACPAGAEAVTAADPTDDYRVTSPVFDLDAPLLADERRHLLVTLSIDDGPGAPADESLMGLTGEMGVGVRAVAIDGEPVDPTDPTTPPRPDDETEPPAAGLPVTGGDPAPLAALALVAAGLAGLGAALLLARRKARS